MLSDFESETEASSSSSLAGSIRSSASGSGTSEQSCCTCIPGESTCEVPRLSGSKRPFEPCSTLAHPPVSLNLEQTFVLDRLVAELDGDSASVVVTNPLANDNPIVYVTKSWQDMCGFTFEGAVGRNPRLTQGEHSDTEVIKRISGALKRELPCKVMMVNYRSGNVAKPFWNMLSISPVVYRGQLQFYMANLQDYSYHVGKLLSLTPAQFCRAAEHHQKRKLESLRPFDLAKPATYEADPDANLKIELSGTSAMGGVAGGGVRVIKRLGWSNLVLEPEHLAERVMDALQNMDARYELTHNFSSSITGISECCILHAHYDAISFKIAVACDASDGTYCIVCTRLSGDTFAYHKAYRQLKDLLGCAVQEVNMLQGSLPRPRTII